MKKHVISLYVVMALVGWAGQAARAQLILNPSSSAEAGSVDSELVAGWSKVDYRASGDNTVGDIERKFIGSYVSYGLPSYFLEFYGLAGYLFGIKPESWGDTGHGFTLGVGTRGLLYEKEAFQVHGFGQFQYLKEDYGDSTEVDTTPTAKITSSLSADGNTKEILLGATASYDLTEQFRVYAGLDVIPYRDGKVNVDVKTTTEAVTPTAATTEGARIQKMKADATDQATSEENTTETTTENATEVAAPAPESSSGSDELKRENWIGIRLGASYDFGPCMVRAEIATISETTFTLGAAVLF